jgi:Glycine-rich domain-containing protein-like
LVQAHLTILRFFCDVLDAAKNDSQETLGYFLKSAESRYGHYLNLLASVKHTPRENWPLPPWYVLLLCLFQNADLARDVALAYHAHLLSPFNFANDLLNAPNNMFLPSEVDFPLFEFIHKLETPDHEESSVAQWIEKHPYMPYQVLKVTRNSGSGGKLFTIEISKESVTMELPLAQRSSGNGPTSSLNLAEAIQRQWRFSRDITTLYPQDPVDGNTMALAQQRYAKFMNLIRLQPGTLVPTPEVDLFWHTHQLCASNYNPWCMHYLGKFINHDDTIERQGLSNGLEATQEAWLRVYNEPYIQHAPAGPLAARMRASKVAPPNVTLAQKTLWEYDAQKQELQERYEYRLKEINDRVKNYEVQVAQIQAEGVNLLHSKRMSIRGLIFDPEVRELESRRRNVQYIIKAEKTNTHRLILEHGNARRDWQKRRWELLTDASGIKRSLYSRLTGSQSTSTKPFVNPASFPLYPATWYSKKRLGTFDYGWGNGGLACAGGEAEGGFNRGTFMNGNRSVVYQGGPVGFTNCGSGG